MITFKVADGREVMWQADPAIWGNSAPVLFPVCGMIKDIDGVKSDASAERIGVLLFSSLRAHISSGITDTSPIRSFAFRGLTRNASIFHVCIALSQRRIYPSLRF